MTDTAGLDLPVRRVNIFLYIFRNPVHQNLHQLTAVLSGVSFRVADIDVGWG